MKTGFLISLLWWLVFLIWSALLLQLSYGFFGEHMRFMASRPVQLEYMSFVKHFAVFFVVFGLSYMASNLLFYGRVSGKNRKAAPTPAAPETPKN